MRFKITVFLASSNLKFFLNENSPRLSVFLQSLNIDTKMFRSFVHVNAYRKWCVFIWASLSPGSNENLHVARDRTKRRPQAQLTSLTPTQK